MAQRTQVVLVDDIDGKELKDGEGQTVTFAVGRTQYEIDLSDKNVGKFYDVLKPYTDVARKVGSSRSSASGGSGSGRSSAPTDKEQLQAMRAWARENGYNVSERGRVSQQVKDAYNQAH